MDSVQLAQGYFYFLPLSFQKFLVLIWLTSEGWKAEATLEPYSDFVVIMFTCMKNDIVKLTLGN